MLSFTSLKEFAKSPNHYLLYKEGKKKESQSMFRGSLVDVLTLTPEEFDDKYFVFDETEILSELKDNANPRATKKYKLWKEGLDVGERQLITLEELYEAEKMRDAALEVHEFKGNTQVKLEGRINGIDFIGCADEIHMDVCTDLKTSKDASYDAYQRSVWNFKYYLQGAIYLELSGMRNFQHVVVENQEPYNACKYIFSHDAILYGQKELLSLTDDFKRWQDRGMPREGYESRILNLPRWAK